MEQLDLFSEKEPIQTDTSSGEIYVNLLGYPLPWEEEIYSKTRTTSPCAWEKGGRLEA